MSKITNDDLTRVWSTTLYDRTHTGVKGLMGKCPGCPFIVVSTTCLRRRRRHGKRDVADVSRVRSVASHISWVKWPTHLISTVRLVSSHARLACPLPSTIAVCRFAGPARLERLG